MSSGTRPTAFADLAGLSSLDDPARRRLYEYVCDREGPVGRDESAAAVGISRSLAAYHLDKLAEHGLLEISYRRRGGRTGPGAGRPAKLYSRSGREFAVAVPPRDYESVAQLLAQAAERDRSGVVRAAGCEAARRVGREAAARAKRGRARASPTGRRRALEETLRERGYEPFEDEHGALRLRNCPFRALAQDHPALVCEMNLALIEGLLAGLGAGGFRATLSPQAQRCCVAIQTPKGKT